MRPQKSICYLLSIILLITAALCGHALLKYFIEQKEQQHIFNEIAQNIEPNELMQEMISSINETDVADNNDTMRLSLYKALAEYNSDMMGWVRIDGTTVNYPVVHTPNSPYFYLKRNFYKKYSELGTPFMQETCTLDSLHILIYGHHMLAGGMFSDLDKYKNIEYWKEHPIIHFDTLNEIAEYEIFAVIKTTSYGSNSFRFYDYNCETPAHFDDYISECKSRSLFDINITPVFGDKLLTLGTCEYSTENGRLIVVARKITKENTP